MVLVETTVLVARDVREGGSVFVGRSVRVGVTVDAKTPAKACCPAIPLSPSAVRASTCVVRGHAPMINASPSKPISVNRRIPVLPLIANLDKPV